MIFGVIKQIYHVWEGYLRKTAVLRLNFPRAFGSGIDLKIERVLTGCFSQSKSPLELCSANQKTR